MWWDRSRWLFILIPGLFAACGSSDDASTDTAGSNPEGAGGADSSAGGGLGQGGALTGTGGVATAGHTGAGGASAAGGSNGAGGASAAGGSNGAGGAHATGGANGAGGASGASSAGGANGAGGASGAGGAKGMAGGDGGPGNAPDACGAGKTCAFDLQGSVWSIPNRIPDIANAEAQYYLTKNVTFPGGVMSFTVKSDTSQPGYSYTSGIAFWDTFSFQYGKLRVRAKFTGGSGPWPTIWLLDRACQAQFHTDPDAGACLKVLEIDFAEPLGSDFTHINQQIHDPFANQHPRCNTAISDGSVNWHTYGFDWSAGKAVFLVDEVATCTITNNVPAVPMFLILNVALGGAGGAINPATLPQTMQVSSVTLEQ